MVRSFEQTTGFVVRAGIAQHGHKVAKTESFEPLFRQLELGLIRTSFRQAMDLLENPQRAPGWVYEDPVVLDSQGQVSRLIVRGIAAVAAQRPDLASTLQRPGTFLDVGAGVGWLTIEAAQSWPTLHVVGIDSWRPACAVVVTPGWQPKSKSGCEH